MSSVISTGPRQVAGLPQPRGPLTARLFATLRQEPPRRRRWHARGGLPRVAAVGTATEEDVQLALYACYELHYQGFAEVDTSWEWDPGLLELRRHLEARTEEELRAQVGPVRADANDVVDALWALAGGGGPSLSSWVDVHGQQEHARELAVHRSAYQLKEADPHTWGIPRLGGQAKASMVAIQADEYGLGDPEEMHAALFARTMVALGLDPTPNHYLDDLPAQTLWTTNVISLFGLHRRLRGALVGHLALFEMTSVAPMARYARALARMGLGAADRRFYQVHVEADQRHQHLAADGMVAGLLAQEPELATDVLFGARSLANVESRFTTHVLGRWESGRCSLRHGAGSVAHRACAPGVQGPGSSAPRHVLPGNVLVGSGLPR